MPKTPYWSENDTLFLRETYGLIPTATIARYLHRPKSAIFQKAQRLGLRARFKKALHPQPKPPRIRKPQDKNKTPAVQRALQHQLIARAKLIKGLTPIVTALELNISTAASLGARSTSYYAFLVMMARDFLDHIDRLSMQPAAAYARQQHMRRWIEIRGQLKRHPDLKPLILLEDYNLVSHDTRTRNIK